MQQKIKVELNNPYGFKMKIEHDEFKEDNY
jgi:hypothetical protein